jgi:uncharacterized repeat protein (TIGR03803 family)
LVQGADGFLYLTCSGGGVHGAGAVFKLNLDATGKTLLYSFGNSAKDGAIPEAPLVQGYDGGFYGTTFAGGNSNLGTIFRLNSDGTGYSLLHSFGSTSNDALSPQTALVQGRDGGLYGTTRLGGTSNFGTVFRVNTNGSDYSVLHSFADSTLDGTWPEAGLVAGNDGALYGATTYGGSSNAGTAFRLNMNGTAYRVLHNFDYPPVSVLFGGYLVQGPDGGLYGITGSDGIGSSGAVFRLNPDGTGYRLLHVFGSFVGDGRAPNSLMLGADGALYGTTWRGGNAEELGTVFRMTPITPQPPFVISVVPSVSGNLLGFDGVIGATYRLEASTNLFDWVTLDTVFNESGPVQFLDSGPTKAPQQFYRAVWVH